MMIMRRFLIYYFFPGLLRTILFPWLFLTAFPFLGTGAFELVIGILPSENEAVLFLAMNKISITGSCE